MRDSNSFLDALSLQRPELRFDRVADCGAGIGRVSKFLLLPRFKQVDLVEQSPRLLAAAPAYVQDGIERMTCIEAGLQVRTLLSYLSYLPFYFFFSSSTIF